jgi:hypothetical protein
MIKEKIEKDEWLELLHKDVKILQKRCRNSEEFLHFLRKGIREQNKEGVFLTVTRSYIVLPENESTVLKHYWNKPVGEN